MAIGALVCVVPVVVSVIISDFHYMIIMAKIMNSNDINVISINKLK